MSDGAGEQDRLPVARSADLRVGDADREQVLGRLREAAASGHLGLDDLAERSGRVLEAPTRSDLEAAVADLPLGTIAYAPVAAERLATPETVELRASAGSIARRGRWHVPRTLGLLVDRGTVRLDLTEAEIEHDVVDVRLDVDHGSVEIRLPEGTSAALDAVEVDHGSVEDHRRDPPATGRPHLVFSGRVAHGSLELRRRRRFRLRRAHRSGG